MVLSYTRISCLTRSEHPGAAQQPYVMTDRAKVCREDRHLAPRGEEIAAADDSPFWRLCRQPLGGVIVSRWSSVFGPRPAIIYAVEQKDIPSFKPVSDDDRRLLAFQPCRRYSLCGRKIHGSGMARVSELNFFKVLLRS